MLPSTTEHAFGKRSQCSVTSSGDGTASAHKSCSNSSAHLFTRSLQRNRGAEEVSVAVSNAFEASLTRDEVWKYFLAYCLMFQRASTADNQTSRSAAHLEENIDSQGGQTVVVDEGNSTTTASCALTGKAQDAQASLANREFVNCSLYSCKRLRCTCQVTG